MNNNNKFLNVNKSFLCIVDSFFILFNRRVISQTHTFVNRKSTLCLIVCEYNSQNIIELVLKWNPRKLMTYYRLLHHISNAFPLTVENYAYWRHSEWIYKNQFNTRSNKHIMSYENSIFIVGWQLMFFMLF